MITASKDSIFRKEAVEKYLQNREKTILPRFVAPPVFLFCWCLLAIFLCIGLLTWFGEVPVYVAGEGVVLSSGDSAGARALIFVPYSSALQLHAGQRVQLQLAGQASQLTSTVQTADRTLLSPQEVRQRYQFVISQRLRCLRPVQRVHPTHHVRQISSRPLPSHPRHSGGSSGGGPADGFPCCIKSV